jgi:hypothetical protein
MVTASGRRSYVVALSALLVVLFSSGSSRATCDPSTDPDKTDIANARAAVAANCDCGGPSHGAYVQCAVQQINLTLQNPSCRGNVKRCASHSTCGKPGAVTCGIVRTTGTKCRVLSDTASCTAKHGTVGFCTSCCDALPMPGSGPSCPASTTTTPTTTSTTTLPPYCCAQGGASCGACSDGGCLLHAGASLCPGGLECGGAPGIVNDCHQDSDCPSGEHCFESFDNVCLTPCP